MRTVEHGWRRAVLLAAILGTATLGRTDPIPGGGNPRSDCYAEFDVQGSSGSNRISCTDGDPLCDFDGACQGVCTFRIALCLSQSNLAACTPQSLQKVQVYPPVVPIPSNSACGAFVDVPVPVDVRPHGVVKPGREKIRVRAFVTGHPRQDRDTLYLTCVPRQGGCPTTTSSTTSPTTTTSTTTTNTSSSTAALPTSTTTTTTTSTSTTSSSSSSTTTTSTTTTTTTTTTIIITTTTTTVTTTTTTSTTTTTLPTRLSFLTVAGTASCGGPAPAGFNVASPPFSGEVDDTSGAKLVDLGLGCLYIGGGTATVAASLIPDAATTIFDIASISGSSVTLAASTGTGPADCSKGPGPGKHCVNGSAGTGGGVCTSDAQCGGLAGSCSLDANCYFGPPLNIPNTVIPALSTCVVNVINADGSGTADSAAGSSTVSLTLASRVYLTGNFDAPCPKCISGTCAGGQNNGDACTPVGSLQTSIECLPTLNTFQAPLPVDLTPLTTGSASKTAANGVFCPNQSHAGAFHLSGGRTITETGMPSGDLTDGAQHPGHLASVFCVPPTGNSGVDGLADLPGPGAIGLNGVSQLLP